VWAAMGMYPGLPGRAELLLASPLHSRIVIHVGNGRTITIRAPKAALDTPYVRSLRVNGQPSTKPWLPESFVSEGGAIDYELSTAPDPTWGTSPADAPPSFPPKS